MNTGKRLGKRLRQLKRRADDALVAAALESDAAMERMQRFHPELVERVDALRVAGVGQPPPAPSRIDP